MSIVKNITLPSGLVCGFHKVQVVSFTERGGVEWAFASVSSWLDRTRVGEKPAQQRGYTVALQAQPGMLALAEAALTADSTCPLYGGVLETDVVVPDLDAAKARKKREIESAKDTEMYAPKATSLGVFDADEASNNKLSLAIQVTQMAAARGALPVAGFKTSAGEWLTLTLDELETIALEMAGQVLPLYAKEAALLARVSDAATIDELDAISWA